MAYDESLWDLDRSQQGCNSRDPEKDNIEPELEYGGHVTEGQQNECSMSFLVRSWSSMRRYCSSAHLSNNKLFVAGLSWSVDEKSLKESFSAFGEVTEVRIAYDRDSGRSRGFGFVHFSKEDDAVSAKDAMDGKALLGRPLRINFAVEKVRGGPVVVPRLSDVRRLH